MQELFWKIEDAHARLAELTSFSGELWERPLRRDVRSLGKLLGTVILEQAGNPIYLLEEELRLGSIAHRRRLDGLAAKAEADSNDGDLQQAAWPTPDRSSKPSPFSSNWSTWRKPSTARGGCGRFVWPPGRGTSPEPSGAPCSGCGKRGSPPRNCSPPWRRSR
jgi:hypothetical protein